MTLRVDFRSEAFPASYGITPQGTLITSWDELLWAAITIGRPNLFHVFAHGPSSFHEAYFRMSLLRMAVQQDSNHYLVRTGAFTALDPTEKGMVSYFLGMTLCKLFAHHQLATPWLLHLDVFRSILNPVLIGASRPDLVGQNTSGSWHVFESKGRSSTPTNQEKIKAKNQASRLVTINGINCSLHIGSFAYFAGERLRFFWCDPEPDLSAAIALPDPDEEWKYYYRPALALALDKESDSLSADARLRPANVTIHPQILPLLLEEKWKTAKLLAMEYKRQFEEEGFFPDGIKVVAGKAWTGPYTASI